MHIKVRSFLLWRSLGAVSLARKGVVSTRVAAPMMRSALVVQAGRARELVSKNSGEELFVSCRPSSIALGENFLLLGKDAAVIKWLWGLAGLCRGTK